MAQLHTTWNRVLLSPELRRQAPPVAIELAATPTDPEFDASPNTDDADSPAYWNGTFPVADLKMLLVTCGNSREEVLARSVDLADEWIRHCWESKLDLPQSDQALANQADYYEVSPSLKTQAVWMIGQLRRSKGMTQAQAAKLIGVSQQAYAKLENPLKSNATLSTLSKVAAAFGS